MKRQKPTYSTGNSAKFMQTLGKQQWAALEKEARERGITVQELIRVVVVYEYLKKTEVTE